MVAAIGALPFGEERPDPATEGRETLPRTSSFIRSQANPGRMLENGVSPGEKAKQHAAREVAWSGEEMERIRIRSQHDPGGTADWAATLPDGTNRHFALETASLAWSATDPAAAAAWAGALPDETERRLVLTNIASEAVRTDPLLALELACDLPDEALSEIVPRAAAEWAAREPAAAADWAGRISDLPLRAKVLAGIITAWSEQDPAAAAMAADQLPAGRLHADTLVSIVQRWDQQSPSDAAEWVGRFPDGPLRDTAMNHLTQVPAE